MQTKNSPHFIIVGTMKSGTTTLLFHLRNHTKVHLPNHEVHFFNREENYEKGQEWYETELIKDMPEGIEMIGEKTPSYSFDPKVAERIHKMYPNAKIIWMFRNPIDRAYSNYLHAVKTGFDYLPFTEAVKTEDQRIKEDIYFGYLKRSIYYTQVERFLKYYRKDQMFFIVFVQLLKNPVEELKALFKFLEISYDDFELKIEYRNKTKIPFSPKMVYYSRKVFGRHSLLHRAVVKLNKYKHNTSFGKINSDLRKELTGQFDQPNDKLAELIGKDLAVWTNT